MTANPKLELLSNHFRKSTIIQISAKLYDSNNLCSVSVNIIIESENIRKPISILTGLINCDIVIL